ncbi:hypothetical protein ACO0R3_001931 [Hanseniaspora guilliermondii]
MLNCLKYNNIASIKQSNRLYSSFNSQTKSFLKLDDVLKSELKKRQIQTSNSENDKVVEDIKKKQYLANQITKNMNMIRGVQGGTQVKIQSNLNVFNNSLSANNSSKHSDSLDLNSLGNDDNYNALDPTNLIKKSFISSVNSVSSKSTLRSALGKIRSINDSTNQLFDIRLRERHMRPCKVKRQKKMFIDSKKFNLGFSDYMSTTYALLRRGYDKE